MYKKYDFVETLEIAIINKQLSDLDIEQDSEYTHLFFSKKDLSGFWISEDDGIPDEICVYIGGNKFFLRYTEEIKNKLLHLLNTK